MSENKIWIKNPLAIWTGNDLDAGGGLVICDNKINELVPSGCQPSCLKENPGLDLKIFDARNKVVLPGFINCHHHFYQTLTRAFPSALNKELFGWLVSLYPIWSGLDEECIALSTELALAELMLSGCTTVSDHHYLFNSTINQAIDIQVDIVKKMGVRAVLTRGSMSLGKDEGGLPPNSVVQTEELILSESERLISRYHQAHDGAMIQIALAPCSPFSVTENIMRDSALLARKHGVLLHTHLAETLDENQFCLERFGQRPVEYLERVGWLQDDVWLAHGIHFTDDEILRLGRAKVAVSHCPSSNMMLASGKARVLDLEAAGCPVGLGVDGSASNDASNMIEEVRQAFLLQRLHYGAEKVGHEEVFRWATKGGADLFRREDIGEIAVGKQADLSVFELDELRFSGSHDPLAALVLCGAKTVSDLMIAGQWRVNDGELIGVDLCALRDSHSRAARALIERHSTKL